MTQINLANLIVQNRPAGNVGSAFGNEAGRSRVDRSDDTAQAEMPSQNQDDQRNLSSRRDDFEPSQNNTNRDDYEANNRSTNDDRGLERGQETQSQPQQPTNENLDRPENSSESEKADSTQPKAPAAKKVNFEEIVANLIAENELKDPKISTDSEASLGTKEEAGAFGVIARNQIFGELGKKADGVVPGKAVSVAAGLNKQNQTVAGQAIAAGKKSPEAGKIGPAAIAVEKAQATDLAGKAEPVAAGLKMQAPQTAENVALATEAPKAQQGPSVEGRLTGTANNNKLQNVQVDKATNNINTNETSVASESVTQTAQPTQAAQAAQVLEDVSTKNATINPTVRQDLNTKESASSAKTSTTGVAVDAKPATTSAEQTPQVTLQQAAAGNPEVQNAQTNRARADRIAAYREVQQSGSTQAKPKADQSAAEVAPKVAETANNTAKVNSANSISQPVSTTAATSEVNPQDMQSNFRVIHDIENGELQDTGEVVKTLAGNTSTNVVAELVQPEMPGVNAVSGIAGVAANPAAGRTAGAEMIEQITTHIQANRDNLGQEMTVRLDPPELGQVRIQLRDDGNGLRGVIQVQHTRTLNEMTREAPNLMQRLNEAGIQVKDLEFQMNDPNQGRGDSAQGQAANAFGEFGGNGQGRGNQAQGDTESASDGQSQLHNDLKPEVDEKYQDNGQYVAEGSLNVMI